MLEIEEDQPIYDSPAWDLPGRSKPASQPTCNTSRNRASMTRYSAQAIIAKDGSR